RLEPKMPAPALGVVDVRPARQLGWSRGGAATRNECWGRDGNHCYRNDAVAAQAGGTAETVPDSKVHAVTRKGCGRVAGFDLEVDLGMGLLKILHAWYQPGRREERGDAHRQQAGIDRNCDAPGCFRDLPEGVADRRQITLSGVSQYDA